MSNTISFFTNVDKMIPEKVWLYILEKKKDCHILADKSIHRNPLECMLIFAIV